MAKKYILKQPTTSTSFKVPYSKELNEAQLEVVFRADGPSLVLAGAGSGKTRTLVYRVLYLLEKGTRPENILLVTFTNKAAFEMKTRVERYWGTTPKGLWCGTFHHVGHRILRMYAEEAHLARSFSILDEEDARDLVRACFDVLPFKPSETHFPRANVVHKIMSFATNVQKSIGEVLGEYYSYFSHFEKEIESVAAEYRSRKAKSHSVDYDDLLTKWIRLLEDHPEIRKRFTGQYQYCLVDEYQDTNCLQNSIIQILASEHRNLLVVGDDAQSIYSFRGAEIKNILDFPGVFPDTKIFKLETNYRSTVRILDLANEIICKNRSQFPKKLKSVREEGVLPQLVRVRDVHEQSVFVVQRILEFLDEGLNLSDIAVLFRARYQSAELELELSKKKIPYVLRGGVRFFEQAHIKDVLSFLKITQNPRDELSWFRCLKQYEGIGVGYATRIYDAFSTAGGSLDVIVRGSFGKGLPARVQPGLKRFKSLMKDLLGRGADEHPDQMVDQVLKHGYTQYALTHFENARDRLDDLAELVNFAHTYKSTADFLDDISLRESFKGESIHDEGRLKDPEEGELVLTTIHQAKGLEWKVVILIGLSEGQFPHAASIESETELEEERRLFYVAVTRAKDELFLVHPMTRFQYDLGTVICHPSPFVKELPGRVYEEVEVWQETEASESDPYEETIFLDE